MEMPSMKMYEDTSFYITYLLDSNKKKNVLASLISLKLLVRTEHSPKLLCFESASVNYKALKWVRVPWTST